MKRIAIIGGGFCGTVTAVNLARLTDAPLEVTVINSGQPLGRGVAYGTRRPEHLLNVVARNMSALADQPGHFVEWLGTRSDFADVAAAELRETFVPRRVYGDYLQGLFLWYAQALADGKKVRIDSLDAEALDIVPAGQRITVVTSTGATLEADKVVLATGNQAPADLPACAPDHPCYMGDPWCGWERRLPHTHQDVVLLGTGLTMVDAFLTLCALGWQGKIYAVSRNALLPQSHFKGTDYAAFPEGDPSHLTLEQMHAQMQNHCGRLRQQGLNPAMLVDKLRPYTQRLWQNFNRAEKARFLREFRTRWNVTRHRIPEPVHRDLAAAIAAGRLELVKGRICEVAVADGGLCVRVEDATGNLRTLSCGAVVNCTGPAEGYGFEQGSTLYGNLLRRGLVEADPLNLGIEVASDFVVLDQEGNRSRHLLALGPPLKGVLWETTAVPELRNQAFRVAEVIVAESKAKRAEVRTVPETFADVMEYSI
jgi:uncharacterized NAD(P)/FAD-binding protein YdhS